MIDLDSFVKGVHVCSATGHMIGIGHGEFKEIITRLRQAEKDAARYRWLRDESAFTHNNAPLVFFTDTNGDQIAFDFDGSSYSVLHDEMLDAAIEEAMQCK